MTSRPVLLAAALCLAAAAPPVHHHAPGAARARGPALAAMAFAATSAEPFQWDHRTPLAAARSRPPVALVTVTKPTVALVTATKPVAGNYQTAASSAAWACVGQHESGNDYRKNTGNGYYGKVQWLRSTWNAAVRLIGRPEYANGRADLAPPAVQDAAAVAWQAKAGWSQWPQTSRTCGLR